MPHELNIEVEPTESYVDSMRGYLDQLWNDARSNWSIIDTYYNMTNTLWWQGSGRPEWLKSSRGRSIIDHAVDHLVSHEPKLKRWPLSESAEDEVLADQVETAMEAIMRQVALKEPSLTWKQAVKHLLLYGYTIVEDAVHTETLRRVRNKPERNTGEATDDFDIRLSVWENQRKTLMPLRTRAPHPSSILMDPWEKEPKVALKLSRRTNEDLYEMTHARVHEKGRGKNKPRRSGMKVNLWEDRQNPFEFHETVEYWTEFWHFLMVEGSMLFVEKNDWHVMNFGHAFSGFGQEPTDATEPNPKYLAVGLLSFMLPELKAHAQAQAGMHNSMMQATFAKEYTSGDAADLAAQEAAGDIIEVPGGKESIWIKDTPTYSRWMFEGSNRLDKAIEFGTFASSQAGIRQQGVGTVGQQAILDTASGRKFIAPTSQMQHLATVSASHHMQMIETLDLVVHAEGKVLKKSMIKGDYSNKVTFEVIDPVFQLQLRQLGLAELQQGVLSDITYMEDYAKRENVTQEQWRLMAMKIRALPPIQMKMALQAARRMGVEDLLIEELEGQFEQGGEGSPGQSTILGPDGNPLESTMGRGRAQGAGNQLRDPLTGQTTAPGRTGQQLAG